MPKTPPDYRQLVHTPPETAAAYVQWARERHADPGVTWGIPAVDKQVIPMHPGELTVILGRPGHGKSSLLAYLARRQADRIIAAGQEKERCVVYCTWESTVEELANFLLAGPNHSVTDIAWGRIPPEEVEKECLQLIRQPIFIIGRGIGRMDTTPIRMTAEAVYHAIESLKEDFGIKPSLLLFDYLQLIPSNTHRERMEQVQDAPIRIKEVAQTVAAPAVAAVQAGRKVDERKEKLPELADAQWASSIEQTADKAFGLWRPALTEEAKTIEAESGRVYQVTEDLLLMRMLKQKYSKGRFTWALRFEPAYLKLESMAFMDVNQIPRGQ